MDNPYVFGGPPPKTAPTEQQSKYPLDFSKVPLLGNAGSKLNRLVYEVILSPYVGDKSEGSLAPGAGFKPQDLLKVRNPRKLIQKIILQTGEANPSSAELKLGELPNGQMVTEEELERRAGRLPPPEVLEMWNADP